MLSLTPKQKHIAVACMRDVMGDLRRQVKADQDAEWAAEQIENISEVIDAIIGAEEKVQ